MSEQWLSVAGYEGLYLVSDQGRVRSEDRIAGVCGSIRNRTGRILSTKCPKTKGSGRRYPMVSLWKDGRCKFVRVHDLVAAAFIGPKPVGAEVLHWDDDPTNNRLENLRYGTPADNGQDARRNNATCRAGHRWTPRNTRIRQDGQRQCLACMKILNDRRPRKTTQRRNRKTTLPQHAMAGE